MNNSSQEPIYTITLDDTSQNTGDLTSNTFSWSAENIPALTTSDIITLTGSPYGSGSITYSNIETIDISNINIEGFNSFYKEEFDGRFPDYDRVIDMCKEYPGLEIAYRKFKEVYKMVKEDYDGKERARRGK